MATHCSILAWKIPWIEEPGGLYSMGWPRVEWELPSKQQQHEDHSESPWYLVWHLIQVRLASPILHHQRLCYTITGFLYGLWHSYWCSNLCPQRDPTEVLRYRTGSFCGWPWCHVGTGLFCIVISSTYQWGIGKCSPPYRISKTRPCGPKDFIQYLSNFTLILFQLSLPIMFSRSKKRLPSNFSMLCPEVTSYHYERNCDVTSSPVLYIKILNRR